MMKNVAVVILAAGKSTRMKSELPKVLHPIAGRPMLEYVIDAVNSLKPERIIAVLGHYHCQVREHLSPGVKVALQQRLLGTGDAVRVALKSLSGFRGTVLVLYGDTPLLKAATIKDLLKRHAENRSDATLLTATMEAPKGYGRILRDSYGSISGIIEENEADDFQKDIKEVNTGIICFEKDALVRALRQVRRDNKKKEYYLTDTIGILHENGGTIYSLTISDAQEAMGVNSRLELAKAGRLMQQRLNEEVMKAGVTVVSPDNTVIEYGARIASGSVIYPFTVIERGVKIGKYCQIGPFAHLRAGTRLADKVVVGNFTEVVRSAIAGNTLMKHFSYIGDSRIGRQVNIGAGTVTANFDGSQKHVTVVKDGAFIGSDTVLIAPVTVGRRAKTGAGAVVTKNTRIGDFGIVAGVPARDMKNRGKTRQHG